MSLIKNIDAGLMTFMTAMRFPKWCHSPLSRLLFATFLHLAMAALFIVPPLMEGKTDILSYILGALLLLPILYHFRLWRQMRTKY
jgi:Ca2+/H+ antiporter